MLSFDASASNKRWPSCGGEGRDARTNSSRRQVDDRYTKWCSLQDAGFFLTKKDGLNMGLFKMFKLQEIPMDYVQTCSNYVKTSRCSTLDNFSSKITSATNSNCRAAHQRSQWLLHQGGPVVVSRARAQNAKGHAAVVPGRWVTTWFKA